MATTEAKRETDAEFLDRAGREDAHRWWAAMTAFERVAYDTSGTIRGNTRYDAAFRREWAFIRDASANTDERPAWSSSLD